MQVLLRRARRASSSLQSGGQRRIFVPARPPLRVRNFSSETKDDSGGQEEAPARPKYTRIELPDLIEDAMKTGKVERWLVEEGAPVETNTDLCLVDTDIAEFYIHSPCDGVLAKKLATAGEEVEVGGTLGIVVDSVESIPGALEAFEAKYPGSIKESPGHDGVELHDGEAAESIDDDVEAERRADFIKSWDKQKVEAWLQKEDFAAELIEKLSHYRGKDLVRLTKEDAEKYFGLEGIRLHGAIKEVIERGKIEADSQDS